MAMCIAIVRYWTNAVTACAGNLAPIVMAALAPVFHLEKI